MRNDWRWLIGILICAWLLVQALVLGHVVDAQASRIADLESKVAAGETRLKLCRTRNELLEKFNAMHRTIEEIRRELAK